MRLRPLGAVEPVEAIKELKRTPYDFGGHAEAAAEACEKATIALSKVLDTGGGSRCCDCGDGTCAPNCCPKH